jgi:hypothetical protein
MGTAASNEIGGASGCRYIGENGSACGAPRKPMSSYCADHHALCYLAIGSNRERREQQEQDRIAARVAGRMQKRGQGISHWVTRMASRERRWRAQ